MVLGALLSIVVTAAPAAAADPGAWAFLDQPHARSAVVRKPTAFLFDRAIEEMQDALGEWQQERREFVRDAAALEKLRAQRVDPPEPEAGFEVEVELGATSPPSSKAKVIELAPPEDDPPQDAETESAQEAEGRVEEEMRRLDAELTERRRRCEADPAWCEKDREERRVVREGNRAWDEAIEAKERAREEAIEAEAKKIQAELDAARRREAEARAKKMGGAIDARGNFVDQDLQKEIEGDAAE